MPDPATSAAARLARRAAADRARRERDRIAVFGHYGRACACCRATDELTIDHIGGGGKTHRQRLRVRSSGFYRWLVRHGFPEGYQTLCRLCNQSKGDGPACRIHSVPPGSQRCAGKCGQVKPLGQFQHDASQRNGHDSRCRDCKNATDRARRAHR